MSESQEEMGKMFVGGLSWETTQEGLHRYFSRFGEVVDCVVMKNGETGRSRGFGFVTFKDPCCVKIVLDNGPHTLDDRTIDPKSCNPRSMQPVKKGEHPKVFLGGLPSNVTETDLRSFFSKCGKVVEVVIMYDQERKRSRGFGFLSFEKEDSVDQVCAEKFFTINGKQVECKKAQPRDGKPMGGGRSNQWNGNGMGMGGMPSPHMGGPPMGGPGMGPPPMPPMPNGMPPAMGYQSPGWGPPPPHVGYPPPGPYGPPQSGPGYTPWGPPPSPYYGGPAPPYIPPPSPYGAYGYGYQWPGPQGAAPVPVLTPSPGNAANSSGGMVSVKGEGTNQQPSNGSLGSPVANTSAQNNSTTSPNVVPVRQESGTYTSGSYDSLGAYQQEQSGYGPSRPFGDHEGYGSSGNGDATKMSNYNSGSHSGGRSGSHSQNYHPYRRQ